MKGITYCGACADYDIKKHHCKRGAKLESNPQDKFFDDCPLPDVEPVRHGRWVVDYPDGTIYEGAALRLMFALITCSECGKTFELAKIGKARYCTCGSKMDLEEQNEP